MNSMTRWMLTWLFAALVIAPIGRAQDAAQPAPFKKEEIEQLVAPIALYPDALVAQILMASTYPLEIVSAARWSKANPNVKDKALEDAMQKQTWDPSVKSLTAFPSVLAMLNDKLDMTQKLGDAFLGQQKEVMAAIQGLRAKAEKAGNLKSSKEQTVTTTQEAGTTVIKIEPADPQVVYVPTYNPTVVYGPWPYPAYPPYYYYPPGYAPGAAFFSFTFGVIGGQRVVGRLQLGRRQRHTSITTLTTISTRPISRPGTGSTSRSIARERSIATRRASRNTAGGSGRAWIRANSFGAGPSRGGRTSRAATPIASSETAEPAIAQEARVTAAPGSVTGARGWVTGVRERLDRGGFAASGRFRWHRQRRADPRAKRSRRVEPRERE